MADLFPSGPWTGFYNYVSGGSRHRMDLQLKFANGLMDGKGSDDINFFSIRGTYNEESTECKWVKSYLGSHDVDYRGWREGRGIWGQWTIHSFNSGGFFIWPKGAGDGETAEAEEELEFPSEVVAPQTYV